VNEFSTPPPSVNPIVRERLEAEELSTELYAWVLAIASQTEIIPTSRRRWLAERLRGIASEVKLTDARTPEDVEDRLAAILDNSWTIRHPSRN
jgi:hypothetical protein